MTCLRERIRMKRRRPQWTSVTCVLATVLASWSVSTGTVPFVLVDASLTEGEERLVEARSMNLFAMVADDDEFKQHIGYRDDDGYVDDTPTPTDTTRPSPSPSMVPSASPSRRPTPPPTLPPTPPPTPPPTLSPTPPPTKNPTPPPTLPPTPVPTSTPTSTPTLFPTPPPPPPPTQSPTSLQTPLQTPSPTVVPSTTTTTEPTQTPTEIPSSEPTMQTIARPPTSPTSSPTMQTTARPSPTPTSSPSILTPKPSAATSVPTMPPQKVAPVQVPITPFSMTLTVDSTESTDEELAESLDNVLTDYLTQSLAEALGTNPESVVVDLTVTPVERRRKLRRLSVARSLQDGEMITFSVTGDVFVPQDGTVDDETLAMSVNSAIENAVEDFDEDAFLDYIETHPEEAGNLSGVSGASAELQNDNGGGDSKPSVVSIVFGSILVLLGVAMTAMYGYVFWKKRKKRAARRRQQKLVAQPQSTAPRVKERTSPPPQCLKPSFVSRSQGVVPTPQQEDASSSEPDLEWTSGSSSGEDEFAKELKWAASLDKRVWEEYEMRQEQMHKEGRLVGDQPPTEPYAQQRMIHGPKNGDVSYFDATSPARQQDVEMFHPIREESRATVYASPLQRSSDRGEVRGLALTSFPYGDENREPLVPDEGVEWTTAGMVPDTSTQNNDEGSSSLTPFNAGWSDTTASDPAVRELLAEAAAIAPNDADKAKEEADRVSSFSDPFSQALGPVALVGVDQETDRALPDSSTVTSSSNSSGIAPRASPTSTTTTTGAVRTSPTMNEPLPAGGKDGSFVLVPPKEETSNDSESLLTSEIVREVQNLSRFVKRYEKKRERQDRKRKEKEQLAASVGADVRSAPKLGYDTLSDSASAQKMIPTGAMSTQEFDQTLRRSTGDTSDESIFGTDDGSSSSEDSSLFSSESSGNDTPEASDVSDSSRLGISPFKVQKLLSLSAEQSGEKPEPEETDAVEISMAAEKPEPEETDAVEIAMGANLPPPERKSYYSYLVNSARFRRASRRGDTSPSDDMSPDETGIEGGNTTLSALRRNEAILDNTESEVIFGSEINESDVPDPFAVPPAQVKWTDLAAQRKVEDQVGTEYPDEGNDDVVQSAVPASQNAASLPVSSPELSKSKEATSVPAPRSIPRTPNQNKGFNKIINLFESKPKDAIFPPNESWQYNY